MVDLEGTTSYAYDDLYRLTGVIYPDGEQVTYAYDPMGNRTAMTSTRAAGRSTYTYDAGDRLLAAGGDCLWLGRQRATDDSQQGRGGHYTYDALDRLTQVVSGTTTVAVHLQRRRRARGQDGEWGATRVRAGRNRPAARGRARDGEWAERVLPLWREPPTAARVPGISISTTRTASAASAR